MNGWGEYALAWVCFLAAHVLPAAAGPRAWLIGHLGRRGYLAVFSAVSVGLLIWLIRAAGQTPFIPLWDSGEWGRWTVNLAMPVAILTGALSRGLPGIVAGFAIWAGAHLVANGDLAHAILFGGMLGFAISGALRSGLPNAVRITLPRIAMAAALWLALLALHPLVVGVSPLP